MFSRKTLGIAGAAILGTLVGTNAAHAEIVVDADGDAANQVKYAKETLTTNSTVSSGGKTYYVVKSGGGDHMNVKIPVGIGKGGTNENLIVLFTLGGMVFTENSALSFKLTAAANTTAKGTARKIGGGGEGDSTVEYSVAGTAVDETDVLRLDIAELAVDPAAIGSITSLASYNVTSTRTLDKTVTISDAVTTVGAIKDSVVAATSTPIALVEEGFKEFGGGTLSETLAKVGDITIELEADDIRAASDSELLTTTNMATELLGTEGAKLNFTGEIEFVDNVFLAIAATCATHADNVQLYELDSADVKIWEGDAAGFDDVDGTGGHLCIMVDGKTVIPMASYAVTITYDPLANAAFPPAASTKTVGVIDRDGTTVHIPYLTTDDRYNQKLVIVNRNASAVEYTLTFTGEEDVTPTAGGDATGMLPPGRTVLSLRNDDVVSFGEGEKPRTAATLEVVSIERNISVAVVTLTRDNGSVDTVTYK